MTMADDSRRADTVQILVQWRCPVSLSVAMELLQRAMHTTLHRRIAMAIEFASTGGVFFDVVNFIIFLFSLVCLKLVQIVWAAVSNNGCRFGHV
jgi:hypothetical protein